MAAAYCYMLPPISRLFQADHSQFAIHALVDKFDFGTGLKLFEQSVVSNSENIVIAGISMSTSSSWMMVTLPSSGFTFVTTQMV